MPTPEMGPYHNEGGPRTEQEHQPLFDVALVHCYWLSQKGETGKVKLSLRSRLSVRAAALAYHTGLVGNLVFTVGKIWGEDYPSVAQKMAEELSEKYQVPQERIIVSEDAFSTKKEITTFLQIAKEKGWTKLLDISAKAHQKTIPALYQRMGQEVSIQSVEGIIGGIFGKGDDVRVKKLVERLGRSKYELGLLLYEAGVRLIMRVDPDYTFLDRQATAHRHVKSRAGPPGIFGELFPNDKHDL